MAISKADIAALEELLAPLGPIRVRRMFGGAGISLDGLMFALQVADALYLKADGVTAARFEAEGLAAFSYETRDGRRTIMSYRRAPERLYDDPDEVLAWGRIAIEAARRAAAPAPAQPRARGKRAARAR